MVKKISDKEYKLIFTKMKKMIMNNDQNLPIFLDNLKKKYNITKRQASKNNGFLKYM